MKIRIHSDLHLEFCDWTPPVMDADVVVLAGDIHCGVLGVEWAARRFPETHIIYVPGNHEFYGARLEDVLGELRVEAGRYGVHLLDGDEVVLDGVRFLGATLWTDFALYGSSPPALRRAFADAEGEMNDYRVIRYGEAGRFRPEDAREIHLEKVAWLGKQLSAGFEGPTVVVTHHLPHVKSIHPKYDGDRMNPSFVSDLSRLVREPVALWVHGHTHESVDYTVNGTRVVCNPRGYLPMEPNPSFDPGRVVAVDGLEQSTRSANEV